MSGTLKDVMRERADAQAPPMIDVDAIVRTGDRRRRTRAAAASVAVAAATLGALALPQLAGGPDETRSQDMVAGQGREARASFAERRTTYAVDDVIHYGNAVMDVGRHVASFVQTDQGFVYTSGGGDVWLWDGNDSVRVGHAQSRRLRADDTGPLVAWVDRTSNGAPEYVVFDTSSRTDLARVPGPSPAPGDEDAEIYALDDGAAYWGTAEGLVRYDVETGNSTVLARSQPVTDPAHKPEELVHVVDVADGRIAYVADSEHGTRLLVGESIGAGAVRVPSAWGGIAALSPDGRHLGVEADRAVVFDTTSGRDVTPGLDGYGYRSVYGWSDDETALVVAVEGVDADRERFRVDFLTCDVPEATCREVARTRVGQLGLVLPTGDPMDT